MRGIPYVDCIWVNVFCDNGSGSNYSPISYIMTTWKDDNILSNPDIIANNERMAI